MYCEHNDTGAFEWGLPPQNPSPAESVGRRSMILEVLVHLEEHIGGLALTVAIAPHRRDGLRELVQHPARRPRHPAAGMV